MKNKGLRVCQIISDIFSILLFIGELLMYIKIEDIRILSYKYYYIGEGIIISELSSYVIYCIITLINRDLIIVPRLLQLYCFVMSLINLRIISNGVGNYNVLFFFLFSFVGIGFLISSLFCQGIYEKNQSKAEESKLIQSDDKGKNGYSKISDIINLYPSSDDGNNQKTSEGNMNGEYTIELSTEKEIINKPCDSDNLPPPAYENS